MSEQPNPYAPPRLESDFQPMHGGGAGSIRREGHLVVIPVHGVVFPPRCVICNQPATQRLQRRLFWHPPAYYLAICAGVLIYVIIALLVRKSASCEVGLCAEHASRRRMAILAGWVGVPLLFIGGVFLADTHPLFFLVGILLSFSLMIATLWLARVVSPARIDTMTAWLKVGRPFLDSLP
jgi:hypothetical protein